MDDLISRQAAIDALNDEFTIIGKTNAIVVQDYIRRVKNRLHDLPSVQPEIIRCKDCKYYGEHWYCEAWNNSPGFPIVDVDGYCYLAERRDT